MYVSISIYYMPVQQKKEKSYCHWFACTWLCLLYTKCFPAIASRLEFFLTACLSGTHATGKLDKRKKNFDRMQFNLYKLYLYSEREPAENFDYKAQKTRNYMNSFSTLASFFYGPAIYLCTQLYTTSGLHSTGFCGLVISFQHRRAHIEKKINFLWKIYFVDEWVTFSR